MVNQERLVAEFLELVQVDSESKNEAEIAKLLKEKLTALGLEVTEDETKAQTGLGSGNLIARLKGSVQTADPILFSCHFDTVTPGNGVKPVINGDLIETDKTTILGADDKAGIAALLEGIRLLKEENVAHGDVEFVLTAGEEIGLIGATAVDKKALNAKYGFALDSGGSVGEIIVASPDHAKIKANVHGIAAHAGVAPEEGVSAIEIAAKAITNMPLGRLDEELTANIGMINGGLRTNIVCDLVTLTGEARAITFSKLENQMKVMSEALEKAAVERGCTVDIDVSYERVGYTLKETDPVVQVAKTAIEQIGRTPDLCATGGGSDANIFTLAGIPTANLGVGYLDIHSKEEKMPISELVKLSELVVEIVKVVAVK
ncbi:MAG: M20/M25/M40 family metallo-hydrolase [Defluviitaleaceae bacterium]|nr:M20/M25/M40 family metallo-hydrolase [Defluviitaleaceae bacterium]